MTDHIHIDDIDYPEPEEARPEKRLFGVTPIRLRHLVWLVGFGGLVGGVFIFGSPHLRFTYSYTKHGDQYHYHRCDYVGWHSQRFVPNDGKCPLIKFFKTPAKGN